MATTTEKDETKVTLSAGGRETESMTMTEFEDATSEAVDRTGQLSFDVGGREPNLSSVKTNVDLLIGRQLRKGTEVVISVSTVQGDVLATGRGKVVGITFEDEYKDGHIVGSARVHKVKIGV